MSVADSAVGKNPLKVRAGQIGARKRWGGQRILRLDQLDPDERRLIEALLAAKERADASNDVESGSAA